MSLVCWLPLNGDLNNYGASDASVTNTNAVINTTGKIGSCYSFGTANSYLKFDNINFMHNFTECSVSLWVKILSWQTSYATYFQFGLGSTPWNNYIFGLLRNGSTSNLCFTISNGSSATNAGCLTPVLELNTWYHLTLTYTTGHCKIYVNGVQTNDYSTSIVPNFTRITTGTIGVANNLTSYQTNCLINDFRVYDHCLSAAEVREISQGLILHYKLDSSYNESSQNLCTAVRPGTGTNITWGGHVAQWTNYDATNDPVPFNEGTKGEIVYGSNGSTGGGASRSICTVAASPSTAYTYSCYIKASDNLAYTHANFLYKYEYTAASGGTKITEAGYFNNARKELLSNGWYRIWGTFTTRDTTNGINISFYTYPGKNVTYWLGGWQIEQKDHVTPFMSPGTSRNNTIIQDSSGYGHNGAIIGTATTVTSPRYSFGIAMNNTSTANRIDAISLPSEVQTISLWVKGNKATNQVYFADKNSALEFGTYSSLGVTNLTSKPLYNLDNFITNEWNHIVVIKDSTNNKLYVNGIAATTSSSNDYYTHNGGLYLFNRNVNNNYACNGAISDFRAYVTTLDADAIHQLYEVGAKIDNKQNLHTFELIENQSSIKVTKRGQVKCDDLTEATTTKFYKSKDINTNNLIEL